MGRIAAQALETQLPANHIVAWIEELRDNMHRGDLAIHNGEKWDPSTWPNSARGYGLFEAPRGSLGQDTKEIRMHRGVILKHFSARDVVPRWDVAEVHRRATSLAAAHFLDTLLERFPFPVRALQVDGGSEFAAEFELACQQKQLLLFVLRPKSPKLNAHVERSHRTHHEEFYQVHANSDQPPVLNRQLRRWEHTYNCVRPHQSLAYLTPLEFVTLWKHNLRKAKCH